MRKWMLSAGIALSGLALAPAATATVSVNLVNANPVASPGDTITLHVYVTADDFEVDPTVYGALIHPGAAVAPDTQQQFGLPGNWTLAATNCDATRCIAFSQISEEGPVPILATNHLIATLTYDVLPGTAVGVYQFDWQTAPASVRLDFFGVNSAPGASLVVVPEPSTAALLAVGLLGIARAARRRA